MADRFDVASDATVWWALKRLVQLVLVDNVVQLDLASAVLEGAMIESVAELALIIMSDLFGIHPGSAHGWARLAQTSWIDYLAACQLSGWPRR
ncbi:hypothetical protein [Amycolatopsis sp. cmx-11-12]|uniref:hypothetical protein n=1 Tax=Amycolatopsis sp. cmx-11-12 TaxID=2785795 RepID=UPI0039174644